MNLNENVLTPSPVIATSTTVLATTGRSSVSTIREDIVASIAIAVKEFGGAAKPTYGFPAEIKSLREAVVLIADKEAATLSEAEIEAACMQAAPGYPGLTFYRQHPLHWRVCVNCNTARGEHRRWSSVLGELLCIPEDKQ
ncbi:hypothetical protein [Paraburkholderia sp. SIMBA_054]|uniref:hypothetical protein n=1 Tax=Paraburkholderia sp. SIMBA_054 TaxID=3085795 RepID=UPI00397C69AD